MKTILALTTLALAAGCASTPVAVNDYARARNAIIHAQSVGADASQSGAKHLQDARAQVRQARLLIENNEIERGTRKLHRAESDAAAATELARSEWIALEATDRLLRIKQEMARLEGEGKP